MKRTNRWTLIACAAGLSWLIGACFAGADPCDSPLRMLGEQTVDLQPLFEWSSNPDAGERPLSAWKRVRGRIVRETPYGWLVEGEAEGEGQPSKFLLKNPPRERLQRFHELQAQLRAQKQQRANLDAYLDRPVHTPDNNWGYNSISWDDQLAAVTRLQELARSIAWTRHQLVYLQDEHGNFRVDAFALRLNERYEGLPVFDHGYSLPVPWPRQK